MILSGGGGGLHYSKRALYKSNGNFEGDDFKGTIHYSEKIQNVTTNR